jgi:hypothetical protein
MANPMGTSECPPDTGPTMTAMVSGIIADAHALMRQELQLARVEIKQELTKARDAVISIGAGAGAMVWATVLLTLMTVFFINWVTNEAVPLWGCFGIVGGIMLVAGASLLFFGKSRAESINLVPPKTAETMQENVQWLKNPR